MDLAIRMYRNTIASHRKSAENALNDLLRSLNSMDVSNPISGLSIARNSATTLAELTAALSALKAAEDLRFLVEEA